MRSSCDLRDLIGPAYSCSSRLKSLIYVFAFAPLRYQYVLGERTWVEYWPTESECETEHHRPTCEGMEKLVQEYTQYGCRQ